ncbi:hypothetical protein AB0I93_26570 [Streptomyces sp. NPDC049967]|uniref:hypothetical protein n=1 Tax=Streptomyces sp. NPDC049967 TaxID=3155658 RepID=UPI00341F750E
MCVHVHLATELPAGVLTWVERQPAHTLVYADATLASGGRLTAAGWAAVNGALAAVTGQTLATATPCQLRLAS